MERLGRQFLHLRGAILPDSNACFVIDKKRTPKVIEVARFFADAPPSFQVRFLERQMLSQART